MIEDLGDPIYQSNKGICLGQVVWCPVPHLEEVPRILDVDRAASEDHYATKFEIVQISEGHFKHKTKLPIKALGLGDTEELFISKAKMRPCIVISCENTAFFDNAIKADIGRRKHLQDNSVILAPMFGVATPDHQSGFPPIMVARIKAFLYNQFFYLPQKCNQSKLSIRMESIVRLDRLFSSSPSRGVRPTETKLSNEVLSLLLAVVRERLGGKVDENLQIVRELLLEQIPASAKP